MSNKTDFKGLGSPHFYFVFQFVALLFFEEKSCDHHDICVVNVGGGVFCQCAKTMVITDKHWQPPVAILL